MLFWSVILLGLTGALAYDASMYQGYRLVYATPKQRFQLDALVAFVEEQQIDMWSEPRMGEMEIFVSQERFGLLKSFLYRNGMGFTISDRNVAQELETSWNRLVAGGRTTSRVYDWNDYNIRADINDELDVLQASCAGFGLTCSTEVYGSFSEEGNQLKAIHVSNGGAGHDRVSVDSLIHAREHLAGATVMRVLRKLITESGDGGEASTLLNTYDFSFTPVMNPDGYDYTWSSDRFWRKNRSFNAGSSCRGVDLNRNYDDNWSGPGASPDPCSGTYFGPSAASEPETSSYQAFADGLSGTKRALISVHTHGYYLLHPYGDGGSPGAGDFGFEVIAATNAACDAVEGTWGENWDCGNSADVLYETSGGTSDWAMRTGGYPRTLVPELRNDGWGFDPPPSSIDPSETEFWNMFVAFLS